MSNLGWECPVCHLGNAPFSTTCGHCLRRSLLGLQPTVPPPSDTTMEIWEKRIRESAQGESK